MCNVCLFWNWSSAFVLDTYFARLTRTWNAFIVEPANRMLSVKFLRAYLYFNVKFCQIIYSTTEWPSNRLVQQWLRTLCEPPYIPRHNLKTFFLTFRQTLLPSSGTYTVSTKIINSPTHVNVTLRNLTYVKTTLINGHTYITILMLIRHRANYNITLILYVHNYFCNVRVQALMMSITYAETSTQMFYNCV